MSEFLSAALYSPAIRALLNQNCARPLRFPIILEADRSNRNAFDGKRFRVFGLTTNSGNTNM